MQAWGSLLPHWLPHWLPHFLSHLLSHEEQVVVVVAPPPPLPPPPPPVVLCVCLINDELQFFHHFETLLPDPATRGRKLPSKIGDGFGEKVVKINSKQKIGAQNDTLFAFFGDLPAVFLLTLVTQSMTTAPPFGRQFASDVRVIIPPG